MNTVSSGDEGLATLETVFAVLILVPLLFAVVSFGGTFQRWLAQDAAVSQAARLAGEVGGDTPAVRALLADSLRGSGIDPAQVAVVIEPASVGWRQPVVVSATSAISIDLPFLFQVSLPLRSQATARGEVNR